MVGGDALAVLGDVELTQWPPGRLWTGAGAGVPGSGRYDS
jgi:hypothetical protein